MPDEEDRDELKTSRDDPSLEQDAPGISIDGSAVAAARPARITAAMTFQGPLPPPAILQAYDRIIPNGAERIFVVFEKQVNHRHHLERVVVEGNTRRADRGFWAALFLASLVIFGGFWLAYLGKSLQGLAAIFLALSALLTAFLTGRAKQSEELRRKATKTRIDEKQRTEPEPPEE